MLINVDMRLINLNPPPPPSVDNVGRKIDVSVLPIQQPHPRNLQVVCRSLKRIHLPLINHVINRQVDLFALHNPAQHLAKHHVDGLVFHSFYYNTLSLLPPKQIAMT